MYPWFKSLKIARTKPTAAPVASKTSDDHNTDWSAKHGTENRHLPEVLPLSPPPAKKELSGQSTNEKSEILSNQKLTKMHIQAANASTLTLEGKTSTK